MSDHVTHLDQWLDISLEVDRSHLLQNTQDEPVSATLHLILTHGTTYPRISELLRRHGLDVSLVLPVDDTLHPLLCDVIEGHGIHQHTAVDEEYTEDSR